MDTRKLNGRYKAIPVDGGLGETSKGNPELAILFKLTEDGEAKGTQLTWYGYFTDASADITIKALRACGWTGNDMMEWLDFKKALPKPGEVELVIEQEPAQDSNGNQIELPDGTVETRARVRWVNPVGKIGLRAPLAADKAAAFAAKMKGKLLAFDQSNGGGKNNGAPASQRPTPPKGGPAVDPGDVPF